MSKSRIAPYEECPCGSGKKFKFCCHLRPHRGDVPHPRSVPNDGACVSTNSLAFDGLCSQAEPHPIVGVDYAIRYRNATADVSYSYAIGTRIIMADGSVLPVEWLGPGMQFRIEDGSIATVTAVEEPKVPDPHSDERDPYGNSVGRVIGTAKYTGDFPRLDFSVGGEVIQTTPAHEFWSVSRGQWAEIQTFQRGELLRNSKGTPLPIDWIGPERVEFCSLYALEIEPHHNFFVGHSGVWTHNGLGNGCAVPKAAVEEALENGVINRTSRARAGLLKLPDHHIFPQELRAAFAQRGFSDIDSYLVRLEQGVHEAIHYKLSTDVLQGGFWNNQFLSRMLEQEAKLGRLLTRRELLLIGAQMRNQYLTGYKLLSSLLQ